LTAPGIPRRDRTEALRARVVTGGVVGVVVLCALTGLEFWPFSGFRLFSVVRTQEQVSWQLRAVDRSGSETTVDLAALPTSHSGAHFVIPLLPGMSEDDQREAVRAWLRATDTDATGLSSVRVYRVVTMVPTDDSTVAAPVSSTQVLDVPLR